MMKINPKKIFNSIIFSLFVLFLSLYIASSTGYYEYQNKENKEITEEKMKQFEKDIKEGKRVDLKDYSNKDFKNYENNITKLGNSLSDLINDGMLNGLEKTFGLVEKLIE